MNYKVLIVDDHDVSLLLQQILWKNKFNIIPDQARCGEDAIDKAEHQDYDFIIVDFEMYGMRGDQLVKKLRGMEKYKNTPIIVLSSRIDSDAVDTCMLSGADDYAGRTTTTPRQRMEMLVIILRMKNL